MITTADYPKRLVETVRCVLQSLNLPTGESKLSTFVFVVIITNLVTMQTGHVAYMLAHINDVATMADTCSTVSTTFQGIFKLVSLYVNSANIRAAFFAVRERFWSTNIAGRKLSARLDNTARCVEAFMIFFMLLITFCCVLLLIPPLYTNERQLPLASFFPFDWQPTPIYELLYVWQWIVNLYGVCFVVGAHDLLLVALAVVLMLQLQLLAHALEQIGSGSERRIGLALPDPVDVRMRDDGLLVACVRHHVELIRFSRLLEVTFSTAVFLQFVESTSGVCLGIFLINFVNGVNFLKLVFFTGGHLVQLLMYCLVGNEIVYQSLQVGDAAFVGRWYDCRRPRLASALSMVIRRSQRAIKLKAMGIADLDMRSFIGVLRISFSFSTLLKTLIAKQRATPNL